MFIKWTFSQTKMLRGIIKVDEKKESMSFYISHKSITTIFFP